MFDITFLGLLAIVVVLVAVGGTICFCVETWSNRPLTKRLDKEIELENERLRNNIKDLEDLHKREVEMWKDRGTRISNSYDLKVKELETLQQLQSEIVKNLFSDANLKELITCKCKLKGN